MEKDQITAIATIAASVAAVALFAAARVKARKHIWNVNVNELSEKTPATITSMSNH